MQVAVESTGELQRKLTITIASEQIDEKVENRFKELTRTVQIAGFRPGKVPFAVVKRRFAKSVRSEVIGDLMRDTLFKAIEEEALKPAEAPQVDSISDETGKPLEFVATFEVYPEVKLAETKGIAIEKLAAEVAPADIDKVIEQLRKQHAEWVEVKRAAQNGDQLSIDFEGKIAGETFEGGTAKDMNLELGSKSMIEGFEEGLVGAKVGDTVELKLQFPKNYWKAEFVGKSVVFSVQINKITESVLPQLDGAFVKQLEIKEETVDALRAEVKKNLEKQLENTVKTYTKHAVMDKLLQLNPLEIPKALVKQEIERMQKQFLQRLSQMTSVKGSPELPAELFDKRANRRVSLGLILSEIIKAKKMEVDATRVKTMIEELAQSYHKPEEMAAWIYSNKEQMAEIESAALEDQVVDSILAEAQITEKKLSFEEAMKAVETETATD